MTKVDADHFIIDEGTLRVDRPAPPFAAKALLDEARPYYEAGWTEDGPPLRFTLVSDTHIVSVIPEVEDRNLLAMAIPQLIKEYGATRYIVVIDGIASEKHSNEDFADILIIGAFNVLGDRALGGFEIRHNAEGGACLGPWAELEICQGWAFELFDVMTPSTTY
jgi:hypothetical protein